MPIVNPRIPSIPEASTTYIGHSLSSLMPLSDVMVHLMGWRFRRFTTHQWSWSDPIQLVSDDLYLTTPPVTDTRRVITTISPLATHLHVAFIYQAQAATGGIRVELNLKDTSGVVQAGPVVWTTQGGAGTLRPSIYVSRHEAERIWLIPRVAHTGTDPRHEGGTYPGLLEVPSAMQGQRGIFEFSCEDVRLLWAGIWEYPTQELDP